MLPSQEGNENPASAVADNERGVGGPLNRSDFDRASKTSHATRNRGCPDHPSVDREADQLCNLGATAHDPQRETPDRVTHYEVRQDRQHDTDRQTSMHLDARDRREHVARVNRMGRRLV